MDDGTIRRLEAAFGEAYTIEGEVGVGGMATVYLATDNRHGRKVAIKVLRPDASEALNRARFDREIEVAATLTHPNILSLYDSGEIDGLQYYVMPYIEGESLADRLDRESQLPLDVATRIAEQVARALDYAHGMGIVHRDIKPANILLVGDQALIADFGIAHLAGGTDATRLTTAGLSVGTPHYMSPEQSSPDESMDGRADLYSLGCVLFEMIAGEPPFHGRTAQAVMARHAVDEVPSLRTVRRTVSADLEDIVVKATAKVPADRFESGGAMASALDRAREGGLEAGRGRPTLGRRGFKGVAAVGFGLAVASAAVLTILSGDGIGDGAETLDPTLIAVAPFRVTTAGAEDFTDLEQGIPELMYLRLTGDGGTRAVYPGTTGPVWATMAPDGALTDAMAFEGARIVGAGRVILGHVLVTGGEAVLNASVFDAATGALVASTEDVRGGIENLMGLVDELALELLIRSSGEALDRQTTLQDTDLTAVRAYLAGQQSFHAGRYADAVRQFDAALEADSTFAMAGLQLVVAQSYSVSGAMRSRGINAARAGRERLSARDRVLLDAFATSVQSIQERMALWDSAVALMPDRKTVQFLRADYLYHYGTALGEGAAMERAEAGFRRVTNLDPRHAPAQAHLFELAAIRGDIDRARTLGRAYIADETRDYVEYYRWRVDVLEGLATPESFRETAATLSDGTLERVIASAQSDGYDVQFAVAAAEEWVRSATDLRYPYHDLRRIALNRGRPDEARAVRQRLRDLEPESYGALIDVFDALYWGADSTDAKATVVERGHVDRGLPPLESTLPRSAHWVDACAVSLWHGGKGDFASLQRVLPVLEQYVGLLEGSPRSGVRMCLMIGDAQLAVATGAPDAGEQVARLDSLSAALYFTAQELRSAATLEVVRLHRELGQFEDALRAARRRIYAASGDTQALSTHLREEALLAREVGDTEGAIAAARLYLQLRDDPEPAFQAETDEIRRLLTELTGS